MAKKFRTSKKSDKVRKAKPAGYRYRVGDDKTHPLYYKRPSKEEIEKYEAGDKRMRAKIYFESRVERSDSNQGNKLEKGGYIINTSQGDIDLRWDKENDKHKDKFLSLSKEDHSKLAKAHNEIESVNDGGIDGYHAGMVDWHKKQSKRKFKKGGSIKRTEQAIEQDMRIKAKKAGKRESADGNTYYEYRSNRSDKNLKRKFKKGGDVVLGKEAGLVESKGLSNEQVVGKILTRTGYILTETLQDITGKNYDWNQYDTKIGDIQLKRKFLTQKWFKK